MMPKKSFQSVSLMVGITYTVCPWSFDPFYVVRYNLLYKMGQNFYRHTVHVYLEVDSIQDYEVTFKYQLHETPIKNC